MVKQITQAGMGVERAAAIYSLIATARLNDVDSRAWLVNSLAIMTP